MSTKLTVVPDAKDWDDREDWMDRVPWSLEYVSFNEPQQGWRPWTTETYPTHTAALTAALDAFLGAQVNKMRMVGVMTVTVEYNPSTAVKL